MKSNHLIPASLILSVGILVAGYFVGNVIVKARQLDRSVSVKGLAEREVMADLAIWPLNFTEGSNDLAEIEKSISTKSEVVIRFLKDAGIKDGEISRGVGIWIGQGNYWQQVEYLYTALNDIKPAMIEEATKNAREAAEKFAIDSDSRVGKIKTANQGLFTISNRDMNSPHIKTVRVVTTVEFYLND